MNYNIKKLIFISLFLTLILSSAIFVSRVFSYDSDVSHPMLTENIAFIYNKNFDRKLANEEIAWLKWGSIQEDAVPRWMRHFYDPNMNLGLFSYMNSKDWAQSPIDQATSLGGDHTWQKAINSYVAGDKKTAFIALGHVLHLIEDVTVPAHTRLDPHPKGDPFETWVEINKQDKISFDVHPKDISSLSDVFYQLASYSNNYFLSMDTINTKSLLKLNKYEKEVAKNEFVECFEGRDDSGNKFCLVLAEYPYYIDDPIVHTDYFNLLGPKAVAYGAGVVKLFFEEAEKKKQEEEAKSWWQKTKSFLNKIKGNVFGSVLGVLTDEANNDQIFPTEVGTPNTENKEVGTPAAKNGETGIINGENGNQDNGNADIQVEYSQPTEPPANNLDSQSNQNNQQNNLQGNNEGNNGENNSNSGNDDNANNNLGQNAENNTGSGNNNSGNSSGAANVGGSGSSGQSPEFNSGWNSDTTPPQTYATSTLFVNNSTTATTTAVFEFSSSEANSTFGCSLDNAAFNVCSSPKEYNNLAGGSHTFQVKAIDASDNQDLTPEIFNWTIDISVPEISLSLINYNLMSIDFSVSWNSSSTDVSAYEIEHKIGAAGAWQNWENSNSTGQKTFRAFYDDKIYYFRGRAKDNLNNYGPWREIQAEISLTPVVINEIAWMGNEFNSADEWMELYNKTGQDIDLSGWVLKSQDGAPLVNLTGVIPAQGFYLLERTDDNTISNIVAHQIYTGALGNTVEIMELYDSANNLIDATPWLTSWPAGAGNPDYKTMERISPYISGSSATNWGTNNGSTINGLAKDGATRIKGTPKSQNSNFNANSASGTIISCKTQINRDTIWSLKGSPYILEVNSGEYPTLNVGKTLIIEPGVIVKPTGTVYSNLIVKGVLLAQGTQAQPITFTSNQANPQAGDWGSIVFEPNSGDSILDNVIFEYGGYQQQGGMWAKYPMIKINNADIEIKNTIFRNAQSIALNLINSSANISNSSFSNANTAIIVEGSSARPEISNSTFVGVNYLNKGVEIKNSAEPHVSLNSFSKFDTPILINGANPNFSGNQISDNNYNGAYIHWQSNFSQNTAWQKGVVYILMSQSGEYPTIASSTILTIEPGAIIKIAALNYTGLKVNGELKAEGTAGDKIIFTSIKDDSFGGDTNNDGALTAPGANGEWKDIVFSAGSIGFLAHINFKYGGYLRDWPPPLRDSAATLNIDALANVSQGDEAIVE